MGWGVEGVGAGVDGWWGGLMVGGWWVRVWRGFVLVWMVGGGVG